MHDTNRGSASQLICGRSVRVPFALCIGLLACVSNEATAVDFSLLGGFNISAPALSINGIPAQSGSGTTDGLGVVAGFKVLGDAAAIELGAFYMPRSYAILVPPNYSETRLIFPVDLRVIFSVFHLLVGGYISYGVGTVTLPSGAAVSYSDLNYNPVDVGALFGIGAVVPVYWKFGLAVRFQYLLGLLNASALSSPSINYRDFQGLVGVNFTL